jgi:hypothetical protein
MNLITRYLTPGLGILLALALMLAGAQWGRAEHALTAAAKARSEFDTYRAAVLRDAVTAGEKARAAEQNTRALQQDALNDEFKARAAALADADRQRDAVGQLRRYSTDLATSLDRASAQDPAAATCSPPANPAGRVLADMLGRVDGAAADVATFADASRRAGQLCERTHDAVSDKTGEAKP